MTSAPRHLGQNSDNLKPALLRGARQKCPRCGDGQIFRSYLKVAPECNSCQLDFTPQRADDGPAYIVVLVVAHLVGVMLPLMFLVLDNPWIITGLLSVMTVALSLLMLPPIKGMFVSLQWVKAMYGFADAPGRDADARLRDGAGESGAPIRSAS